jgi:hypothetical protein
VHLGKTHDTRGFDVRLGKKHTAKFSQKTMFHLLEGWEWTQYFTVRGGENARQTSYLPCGRTANSLFAVRFFFVMRPIKNARQTSFLPCARNKTHGKGFDAWQTRVFR